MIFFISHLELYAIHHHAVDYISSSYYRKIVPFHFQLRLFTNKCDWLEETRSHHQKTKGASKWRSRSRRCFHSSLGLSLNRLTSDLVIEGLVPTCKGLVPTINKNRYVPIIHISLFLIENHCNSNSPYDSQSRTLKIDSSRKHVEPTWDIPETPSQPFILLTVGNCQQNCTFVSRAPPLLIHQY